MLEVLQVGPVRVKNSASSNDSFRDVLVVWIILPACFSRTAPSPLPLLNIPAPFLHQTKMLGLRSLRISEITPGKLICLLFFVPVLC